MQICDSNKNRKLLHYNYKINRKKKKERWKKKTHKITFWYSNYLEVELGEEPLVLASLVLLLKSLLDGLFGLLTLRGLLEGLGADRSLDGIKLKGVTGGHHVVVVDNLDEGLDLGALGNLLSAVSLGDLQGVSLDTSNQGVAKGVGLGAIVVGLDDDNLLTGKSTASDDG